jgi:hypothetical protein
LAGSLDGDRHFAQQFVLEDFHAGFGPGSAGEGLKYPLRRLRGLRQITEEDERELGELADAAQAGTDASAIAQAIMTRPTASRLARVLAGAAVGGAGLQEQRVTLALAGAIAGAYLGGQSSSSSELLGLLGAAGGALASDARSLMRQLEVQPPAD